MGEHSHAQHVALFKINLNADRNSLSLFDRDFTPGKVKYYESATVNYTYIFSFVFENFSSLSLS